jgi:ribose 5-phosphate isomerase B
VKIFIAADHGGFALKKFLISELVDASSSYKKNNETNEVVDLGTDSEASVDYPDFAEKLCHKILSEKGSLGILVCGSGQGMCMKANRFKNIRAALCWDLVSARLTREHNDANVLCLAGRQIPLGLALDITKIFLTTPFSQGIRHQNRIKKLDLGDT